MASKGPAKYIDRRAKNALNRVTQAFATACEAPPPETLDVWVRRVRPRRTELLDHVDLSYRLQNRFWARIYDFHASTTVVRGDAAAAPKTEVRLKYAGLVGTKSVSFQASSSEGASLAGELNSAVGLADLIRALNLTDVRVTAADDGEGGEWLIDTSGYVGSYTWNFIPPVYQAILPTSEEVNRHLQLLAMLAHIVRG